MAMNKDKSVVEGRWKPGFDMNIHVDADCVMCKSEVALADVMGPGRYRVTIERVKA